MNPQLQRISKPTAIFLHIVLNSKQKINPDEQEVLKKHNLLAGYHNKDSHYFNSFIFYCLWDSSLLRSEFQKAVNAAKKNNLKLLISSFRAFKVKENRELLGFLINSQIGFEFLDFSTLDRYNLKAILDYFNYPLESETKTTKTKQSNPSRGNNNLNSKEIIEISSRKKTQKALFDETNKATRLAAFYLKNIEGKSLNQIASTLNEKGYLTTTGKAIYAKQISRHIESFEELQAKFSKSRVEELHLQTTLDGEENDLKYSSPPILMKNGCNFDNILKFKFSVKKLLDFEIKIKDNKGVVRFDNKYPVIENILQIDILKETILLPGLHYLEITAKGYNKIVRSFYIRKDLIKLPDSI